MATSTKRSKTPVPEGIPRYFLAEQWGATEPKKPSGKNRPTREKLAPMVDEFLANLRNETVDLETRLANALTSLFQSPVLPWDEWLLSACAADANRTALGIPVHMERRDLVQLLGGKRGFSKSVHELMARRLDLIFQMVSRTLCHPLCSADLGVYSRLVDEIRHSLTDKDGASYYRLTADYLLKEIRNKTNDDSLTRYYHTFYDPRHVLFLEALDELHDSNCSSKTRGSAEGTAKELLNGMLSKGAPTRSLPYLWYYAEQLFWSHDLSEVDEEAKKVLLSAWDARRTTPDNREAKAEQFIIDLLKKKEKSPSKGEAKAKRFIKTLCKKDPLLCALHISAIYEFHQLSDSSSQRRHARIRRIYNFGGLEEYLEYESSRLLVVPTALCAIAYSKWKKKQAHSDGHVLLYDLLRESAEKYLISVFCDHGSDALFFMPDNGHLYYIALRLWAVYMFWQWDHVFWTTSCDRMEKRRATDLYGGNSNGKKMPVDFGLRAPDGKSDWARPLARLLTSRRPDGNSNKSWLPTITNKSGSRYLLETQSKGDSVVILGGAGLGKTKLVESWYEYEYEKGKTTLCHITPMGLPDNLKEVLSGTADSSGICQKLKDAISYLDRIQDTMKVQRARNTCGFPHLVLFVDELHIDDAGKTFAKLLIPLEDGIKRKLKKLDEDKQFVRFVFATSKYATKAEFLSTAIATGNTPMRDFATRIGHWIELPPLTTMPEQRAILCHINIRKEHDVIGKYLDLRLKSARDLMREYTPNTTAPKVFPSWVEDMVKVVPDVEK
jgi:hypothetical protein